MRPASKDSRACEENNRDHMETQARYHESFSREPRYLDVFHQVSQSLGVCLAMCFMIPAVGEDSKPV